MDDKDYELLKNSEVRKDVPEGGIEGVDSRGRRKFLKGALGAGAAATAIGPMAPKDALGKVNTKPEHYDLTFKK